MKRLPAQRLISVGEKATPPGAAAADRILLTQEEAAQRLGIGRETLRELISSGTIYAVPVGKRQKRVPIAEIEKFRSGRY
jgi:excisionase family DNA binding protein